MGNKSGKFNVPATTPAKKDEVLENGAEVIVEELQNVDVKIEELQDGDVNIEESKVDEIQNGDITDEATIVVTVNSEPEAAPKKKSVISWLKKLSIRKEKKPKSAKENGVHDDVVETPKENGIHDDIVETPKENGIHDDVVESSKEDHAREEAPIDNIVQEPKQNGVYENIIEPITEHEDVDVLKHTEVQCDAVVTNGHVEHKTEADILEEKPLSNGDEIVTESIKTEEH